MGYIYIYMYLYKSIIYVFYVVSSLNMNSVCVFFKELFNVDMLMFNSIYEILYDIYNIYMYVCVLMFNADLLMFNLRICTVYIYIYIQVIFSIL